MASGRRFPLVLRYGAGAVLSAAVGYALYQFLVLDATPSLVLGIVAGGTAATYVTADGRSAWIGALLGAAALVPWLLPGSELTTIYLFAIITIGQTLVTGFAGQVSVGHGAFVGIGAYIAAILVKDHGWLWWETIPVAAVATTAFGVVIGLPSLRLKGMYLGMATLALAVAFPLALTAPALTGFTHGVPGIPLRQIDASWLPFAITSGQFTYLISLIALLLMTVAGVGLVRSRHGRAWRAIRDNETAAEVMGVNTARYKTLAFAASALYAGLGGALLAVISGYVSPDGFPLFFSVQFVIMSIVGGSRSVLGAILGTALIWEVQLRVPFVIISGHLFSSQIIVGLMIILVILYFPSGLVALPGGERFRKLQSHIRWLSALARLAGVPTERDPSTEDREHSGIGGNGEA
jgi:branched-chain amino acid transport system permease protein